MKIVLEERRRGKTHQLIEMSATTGDIILCVSRQHKVSVLHVADQMGLEIPDPVVFSASDPNQGFRGRDFNGILIDDADRLLQSIMHFPVHAISVSDEGALKDE